MTHFGVLVLTDQKIDAAIDAADAGWRRRNHATPRDQVTPDVTRLLAPFDENDEWGREGSHWDWWQIGGRWTGALTDYEPWTDPANQEPCKFCEGGITTQKIADQYPAYKEHLGKTCIQCKGTTKVLAFHFVDYEGDVQPVAKVDAAKIAKSFAAVVTPDGEWHGGDYGMFGAIREEKAASDEEWVAKVTDLLAAHPQATAVVVDCHV